MKRPHKTQLRSKADSLVEYLEATEGMKNQEPVLELIRAFERLHRVIPTILKKTQVAPHVFLTYKDRRVRHLRDQIESILDRHPVRRRLFMTLTLGRGELPIPQVVTVPKREKMSVNYKRGRVAAISSDHAIELVVELANLGMLRIRRCQNPSCKKWFVASRVKSRCHSPECLRRLYTITKYFRNAMRKSRSKNKKGGK